MVDIRFGNNGIMDVVLERSELVLAIQQRAWLMAKSASEKEGYSEKQGKWLEDIFHGTEEDGSRIEVPGRWIDLAFNTAAAKFSHLALPAKSDRTYEQLYGEREVYTLEVRQPVNMNEYQGRMMADLLFEFVSVYTLWKWCLEVAPEFAETLTSELKVTEEELNRVIKLASTVSKRPLYPF